MKYVKYLKTVSLLSSLCLAFGLSACGDDSSSSTSPDKPAASSTSSDEPGEASSASEAPSGGEETPAETPTTPPVETKTETTSSTEELLPAKNVINGSCAPSTESLSLEESADGTKKALATWVFSRSAGTIYDQVLAPFVWTVTGANNETVQGNGLQEINSTYQKPGSYSASLSVDGNTINCGEVQIQGIPINVESCKPNKASVYSGENITWTVAATSEAELTGYTWSSESGTVSGTGVEGTMAAPAGIHKEKVSASVTITNADNSAVKFACEAVTVLDPSHVDIVLPSGSVNDLVVEAGNVVGIPDEQIIPGSTPTTVQIPADAKNCNVGCKPKVGADYDAFKIMWDSDTPQSNPAYFTPAGCAAGKTYVVTSTVPIICMAN